MSPCFEKYVMAKDYEPNAAPMEIAKESLGLGINPYELVKDVNEKWVFRGIPYLFGKRLQEYRDFDDFFIRDLTLTAKEDYLKTLRSMETKLNKKLIINAADSRLRFITLEPEKLNSNT